MRGLMHRTTTLHKKIKSGWKMQTPSYLGSLITTSGGIDITRINKTRHVFKPSLNILIYDNTNKTQGFHSNVKSVLLNESEYWNLQKELTRKRRMIIIRRLWCINKIKRRKHLSNNQLKDIIQKKTQLLKLLKRKGSTMYSFSKLKFM